MTEKAILKTCELLLATHHLPIACFKRDGKLLKLCCPYPGYEAVFASLFSQVGPEKVTMLSDRAGIYGAIRVIRPEMVILTGPFLDKKPTDDLFDSLVYDYGLPRNDGESMKQFLLSLPRYSFHGFLNFVGLLHYLSNGEEISVVDYFQCPAPRYQRKIGIRQSAEILKENDYSHGTYSIEKQLLSYVSAGDVAGIHAFFDSLARSFPVAEGKLADDTLRQSKNIFIGLICMVGKVGAIRGNLDIEQTYQLIDLYTQECERCTSVTEVNALRYSAILDFTHRVAEHKHPEAYSNDVYKSLQYIKTHTNQPIAVDDVLNHVQKSRSSFMEKFKRETGETLGRYIMKAKLQEAKLLLAYSERSLSDISEFLFFSSQPHFQRMFKKEFGITPLAYRNKHRKE